jgi:hypothetical protein
MGSEVAKSYPGPVVGAERPGRKAFGVEEVANRLDGPGIADGYRHRHFR